MIDFIVTIAILLFGAQGPSNSTDTESSAERAADCAIRFISPPQDEADGYVTMRILAPDGAVLSERKLGPLILGMEATYQFDSHVVAQMEMIKNYGIQFRAYDPCSGAEMDKLRTYAPVVSPHKRWAAYDSWYPRTINPEFRKRGAMVADVSNVPFEFAQVFPMETELPDQGKYLITSPYLWSSDARSLVFSALRSPSGRWENHVTLLVHVAFEDNLKSFQTSSTIVNYADYTADPAMLERMRFAPRAWEWVDDDTVRAIKPGVWPTKTVELDLPK